MRKILAVLISVFTLFSATMVVKADSIPEEPDVAGFVEQLYLVCFDRQPDRDGFEFWLNKLTTKEMTASEVVAGFFFSDEYKALNKSKAEYVEDLYCGVLGRQYDLYGFEHWQELYNMNYIGITSTDCAVLNGFVQSEEFTRICEDLDIEQGEMIISFENVTKGNSYELDRNCKTIA